MRRSLVIAVVVLSISACKFKGFGGGDGGTSIITTLASLVSFEGEIDMKMESPIAPGVPVVTSFAIKGDKMRMEATAFGAFVTITDAGAKKTWMLDKTGHTYTEIDLSALSTASTTSTKPKTKVTKTGKSDTVVGYKCEVYEVDDATGKTEVCVASGLSMLALGLSGPFSAFTSGGDGWSEVLSHGFPLRMVMRDPTGVPIMKMEASRVEKKSLPDSDFQVPAGYTKTASPFGLPAPTSTATSTRL